MVQQTYHQLLHGRKSAIGNSAVAMSAVQTICQKGITIRADVDNTDKVYIGGSGVTCDADDTTDGYPLDPGESITLAVDQPDRVFLRAPTGSQKVFWVAV